MAGRVGGEGAIPPAIGGQAAPAQLSIVERFEKGTATPEFLKDRYTPEFGGDATSKVAQLAKDIEAIDATPRNWATRLLVSLFGDKLLELPLPTPVKALFMPVFERMVQTEARIEAVKTAFADATDLSREQINDKLRDHFCEQVDKAASTWTTSEIGMRVRSLPEAEKNAAIMDFGEIHTISAKLKYGETPESDKPLLREELNERIASFRMKLAAAPAAVEKEADVQDKEVAALKQQAAAYVQQQKDAGVTEASLGNLNRQLNLNFKAIETVPEGRAGAVAMIKFLCGIKDEPAAQRPEVAEGEAAPTPEALALSESAAAWKRGLTAAFETALSDKYTVLKEEYGIDETILEEGKAADRGTFTNLLGQIDRAKSGEEQQGIVDQANAFFKRLKGEA